MTVPKDRFLPRLIGLTAAAALLMVLWHLLPALTLLSSGESASPRAITPRGDLAADEKSTIQI